MTGTRGNPLSRFSRGFFSPFQAGKFLLRHPGLVRFVMIPFLINLLVFSAAVYLGFHFFNSTVSGHIPSGEAWYWALLYYFLWVVAVLLTAVLVFFTFTVVGNLIASPFNDLLSERTEEILAGRRIEENFSFRLFWRDARRTFIEEVRKIGLFVGGMILLLLLNLIPVIGTLLYAFLSILFTLFFLVVEYTGYVFGRKRVPFRDQRRYIFARPFLMLGFGCGVLAVLAIPFLQFLCIPVAVVGATQLCFESPGQTEGMTAS